MSSVLFDTSITPGKDFPLGDGENDNYQCECLSCGSKFRGHKRAMGCLECTTEAKERWDAMSDEERAGVTRKIAEEVEAVFGKPV